MHLTVKVYGRISYYLTERLMSEVTVSVKWKDNIFEVPVSYFEELYTHFGSHIL